MYCRAFLVPKVPSLCRGDSWDGHGGGLWLPSFWSIRLTGRQSLSHRHPGYTPDYFPPPLLQTQSWKRFGGGGGGGENLSPTPPQIYPSGLPSLTGLLRSAAWWGKASVSGSPVQAGSKERTGDVEERVGIQVAKA